jgi:hypothetical protein
VASAGRNQPPRQSQRPSTGESALNAVEIREIQRALEDLRLTLRTLAPLAGQVGIAEAKIEDAEQNIGNLQVWFRELEKGMNEVIRSGRSDTLKYVAFTVGPGLLAAGAIVAAFLTGAVPGR